MCNIVDYNMISSVVFANIIGYGGSVICILSFIFQMWLVYQNKSAKDISWLFIGLQLSVNILFTVYNLINFNPPLLLGNGTLVMLLIGLCGQKVYYDKYHTTDSTNNTQELDNII